MEVVLDQKDERGAKQQLLEDLELIQVLDRDVEHLSGAASAHFLLTLVPLQYIAYRQQLLEDS